MELWFSIPTFSLGIVTLLVGRSWPRPGDAYHPARSSGFVVVLPSPWKRVLNEYGCALRAPLSVLREPLPVGPSPFHSVMLLRIISSPFVEPGSPDAKYRRGLRGQPTPADSR